MKKIVKKINILSFILGAIIFGSISLVSAYTLFASSTDFTPTDANWDAENVQSAIDDLYLKCNKKLNVQKYSFNDSYGVSIASRPVQITLEAGDYVIVVEYYRAWNGPGSAIERNISDPYAAITCSKNCISKNVSNYWYYHRGTQAVASSSYVKYMLANSLYYVRVLDDDTIISTNFITDVSNVAPSNVDLTAIKITNWKND